MKVGDRVKVTFLTYADMAFTNLKIGDTGTIVGYLDRLEEVVYVNMDLKEDTFCFSKRHLEVIEEAPVASSESVSEDCDTVIQIKSGRKIESISIYFAKEDEQ